MVTPLLDTSFSLKALQQKVRIVPAAGTRAALLELITEDELDSRFGGRNTLGDSKEEEAMWALVRQNNSQSALAAL
jgi:hypothetical protein